MLRNCAWLSVMMFAGSGLLMSGCAEQGPKPGGVTTVSPATKPGTPADPAKIAPKDAPATTPETKPEDPKPDDDKVEEPKAAPSPDAGSTTGGGTETPSTPGEGQ